MYAQTTNGITVSVKPLYLEEQSAPQDNHYVWAYQVRIENATSHTFHLRSRYWKITDGLGHIQEIRGAGVVGEQPILKPGAVFEYTSGTPLTTASGIMEGSYQMEDDTGAVINIPIPAFSLDSPYDLHTLN